MSHLRAPAASPASLAALVEDLVAFLRDQGKKVPEPRIPPEGLERSFDTFGHHWFALMLVARSDSEVATEERERILDYCRSRARSAGLEMTTEEEMALRHHLTHFRPTL